MLAPRTLFSSAAVFAALAARPSKPCIIRHPKVGHLNMIFLLHFPSVFFPFNTNLIFVLSPLLPGCPSSLPARLLTRATSQHFLQDFHPAKGGSSCMMLKRKLLLVSWKALSREVSDSLYASLCFYSSAIQMFFRFLFFFLYGLVMEARILPSHRCLSGH